MKRRAKGTPPPSTLHPGIRAVLARTARARAIIDENCAGVTVDGGPPELGAKRSARSVP